MGVSEVIRHQVAIAGQVTNAQTGRSLEGVRVEITAAPAAFTDFLKLRKIQFEQSWEKMAERPDRTNTMADGSFRFLDLLDGQYKLTASLPGAGSRYGRADAIVTVTRDSQGKIARAAAQIALPPTTIKGKITAQGAGALQMAEVRVKGSGESTFSDAQGQYLLVAVEAGARTVLVSAQAFQQASQAVTLNQPGAVQTVDVALIKPP